MKTRVLGFNQTFRNVPLELRQNDNGKIRNYLSQKINFNYVETISFKPSYQWVVISQDVHIHFLEISYLFRSFV